MSFIRHSQFERSDRGQRAYQSGVSAENAVERLYQEQGHETAARRWS